MSTVFDLLEPSIQQLLKEKNITTPTEPQRQAIPSILKGKHTLLIAPTGLGKTESALLPVFNLFLDYKKTHPPKEGISILYITPLRALNRDMLKRTITWGKHLDIKVAVRHGDTTQNERNKQSRNPPDLLITTPETLQILFTGKRLRRHLHKVRWIIVDEVHELATSERGAQLAVALERLQHLTQTQGHTPQRIGLSATVGKPKEVANYLGGMELDLPRKVSILQVDVTKHIDIQVQLPKVQSEDYPKAAELSIEPISMALIRRCQELIKEHTRTLLFINTRDGSEILASRFHQLKTEIPISVHHGSLSKNARIESENDFKAGKLKALISTSSLELGIDVGETDYVIQYNSPREVTRIVQRIGRSGHQIGKTSKGMILATNTEDLAESMVIARKALHGELEENTVRANPLSVLANQIISITLEYGKIPPKDIYSIIKASYPFHSLSYKIFERINDQLKAQRNIWIEEAEDGTTSYFSKRQNSRRYFLDNISMIPDEKTYPVIDITTRKTIGTLDEGFVLASGFEGSRFILRGRPWVIIQRTDEDELLVNPIKELGNVPSWVGEDIPVPFEVALEVGALRRMAAEHKNITGYPTDHESIEEFKQFIANQQKQDLAVPSDKTITIEIDGKSIIINACFGTKVNETLARLISSILMQSLGESIGINSDAYRINLELPGKVPPERITKILLETNPDSLEYIIETIMKNSTTIRYQLIHTARKMGSLRKDFDPKALGVKRLFSLFEHSLIFDEALDKLLYERMDIATAQHILRKIQQGDIELIVQRIGPISTVGLEAIRGLMAPQRADRTILMAVKRRLEDVDVTMICTNCKNTWDTAIKRLEINPICHNCGAKKIAILRRYQQDQKKLLKKKKVETEDKKELRRLHTNAGLVLQWGKFAAMALVARGIGPDTAARILRRYSIQSLKNDETAELEFLRDILKAELTYARTRGFWDK